MDIGSIGIEFKHLIGFFAVQFSVITMIGCHEVPITKRQAFVVVPESHMTEIAINAFDDIKAKSSLSRDNRLIKRIEGIGFNVAAASGFELPWEFLLVDEPASANAFCLPGGKVVIYTGILPIAKTDAGLASIIGHEIGHVIARHGGERATQKLGVNVGLVAISLFLDAGNLNRLIMETIGMGANVGVLLPFSRLHESEADRMGLEYMAKAGYNPNEAVGVWERMGQKSGNEKRLTFLSTHPNSDARAKDLALAMEEVMPFYEQSKKRQSELLTIEN